MTQGIDVSHIQLLLNVIWMSGGEGRVKKKRYLTSGWLFNYLKIFTAVANSKKKIIYQDKWLMLNFNWRLTLTSVKEFEILQFFPFISNDDHVWKKYKFKNLFSDLWPILTDHTFEIHYILLEGSSFRIIIIKIPKELFFQRHTCERKFYNSDICFISIK